MKLPSIEGKLRRRPGASRKTKQPIYVPDEKKYPKFWREWYQALDATRLFELPFEDAEQSINPFFGYYGFRWHPVAHEPDSFHTGLDFSASKKTDVGAVANGILEYSGYDVMNGNYVMLSHPEIILENEDRLMTIYMHLRSNVVKFTSYQKMLREISLHTYPEIPIKKEETIGEVGNSGEITGSDIHLHLQVQIKRKKGGVVALDPARVLGIIPKQNMTATIENDQDFCDFYKEHQSELERWDVVSYWKETDKE